MDLVLNTLPKKPVSPKQIAIDGCGCNGLALLVVGVTAKFCRDNNYFREFMAFLVTGEEDDIKGIKLAELYSDQAAEKLSQCLAIIIAVNTKILPVARVDDALKGGEPLVISKHIDEMKRRLPGFAKFFADLQIFDSTAARWIRDLQDGEVASQREDMATNSDRPRTRKDYH